MKNRSKAFRTQWLFGITVLLSLLFSLRITASAEPKNCPYSLQKTSITYQFLPEKKRKIFDEVYDAIRDQKEMVKISGLTTWDEAYYLMDMFFNECPELCSFSRWEIRGYDVKGVWTPCEIHLKYKRTKDEQERFINYVASISRSFKSVPDVYEYLCLKLSYGDAFKHPEHQYAYESLTKGKAVCNGYAESMAMLCHFANLECSFISGDVKEGGGHSWNIARISGRYTLLDCTWDDDGTRPGYRWYALSDSDMAKSRKPNKIYNILPAAINMQGAAMISKGNTPAFTFSNLQLPIQKNDSGSAVTRINKRLIELGYLSGKASSRYDQSTKNAVEAFQRDNGIHGVSGSMGVCTKLTQAALFSKVSRHKNEDTFRPTTTISKDPVSFFIGSNYGVRINGSKGTLTFILKNNNTRQPLTAIVLRYWADDAKGKLVYEARDQVVTGIDLAPQEAREITVQLEPASSLARAALLKWNVIEVAFANGEVFLKEDLSSGDLYYIPTYNEKIK